MNRWIIRNAVRTLRYGGIIAYPTEAVYGLGCDPMNTGSIRRLLELKCRRADQGLILIAASFNQLEPLLAPVPQELFLRAQAVWPGPVTWIWPASEKVPAILCGNSDSLAVRVTAHPLAAKLCTEFGGPIVSTSANRSGAIPAKSPLRIRTQFGHQIDSILHGPLGGEAKTSEIRDLRSGRILRPR